MDNAFGYTLTDKMEISRRKGLERQMYGGVVSTFFTYLPYILVCIFAFYFTDVALPDTALIQIISPITIIVIGYLIWDKFYAPWFRKRLAKSNGFLPREKQNGAISINEEGIVVVEDYKTVNMTWGYFDKVTADPNWVYFHHDQTALTLPVSTFATNIKLADFITDCQAKIKLAREQNEKTN